MDGCFRIHLTEGHHTFAVGHVALGFLLGKTTSKLLRVDVNISLLLLTSIISDIDLLIPGLAHRGPTHSIVFIVALTGILLFFFKEKAIPYAFALISHPLLGDFLTSTSRYEGVQLLFPLTTDWYFLGSSSLKGLYAYIEIVLFICFLILLIFTGSMKLLIRSSYTSFVFTVPVVAALLPAFFNFPMPVPRILILPHLILIVLLTIPIFFASKGIIYNKTQAGS